MSSVQWVVVGGGNMGEAMLRGVLGANMLSADRVAVVEPIAERRELLGDQLGILAVGDLSQAAGARRYTLAVKPHQMSAMLPKLAEALPAEGATVVSIAAGISTGYLAERLGGRARIIRAMPNTPMLVGCGCTGICPGPGATEEDMAFAKGLFGASGEVLVVDEKLMDAVTAVSGSGPAYFFYLIEAMVSAGVAEGLDEATAVALARQTCAGAAALLANSAEGPAVLRRKVTSPGGTTQAAIETMDAGGVKDVLIRAVRAAAAKSRELGR